MVDVNQPTSQQIADRVANASVESAMSPRVGNLEGDHLNLRVDNLEGDQLNLQDRFERHDTQMTAELSGLSVKSKRSLRRRASQEVLLNIALNL